MHHNALNLVGPRFFQRCDAQLARVRNPIHELLMLEGLLIELKSFQVRYQQLGTLLDPDFFSAYLLGLTCFTLELIGFI